MNQALFTADDATPLAAERLPGPGPTIVLLHAGVADRRVWGAVAEGLNAAGADVVAYDRRGFGETAPTDSRFDHVADLRSLLDQVSDTPAWLVGNSQGGRIALDLALAGPERVAGLVLIAPAISGAPRPGDEQFDPATRRIIDELEEAEDSGDLDAINELEVRLWLDGPAGPDDRVSGDARQLALSMNSIALLGAQPDDAGEGGHDAWAHLEEIQTPITVAWGELDVPVVIEECRTLAARLGNLQGEAELPGVAHLPMLERPELVVNLVRKAVEL